MAVYLFQIKMFVANWVYRSFSCPSSGYLVLCVLDIVLNIRLFHCTNKVNNLLSCRTSKEICLTSRIVTFTIITWIVPRFTVVHYFRLILCYHDGHAIHSHLPRLPRRPVDVFQSDIFRSFVFTARKLGRFWAIWITWSGKLNLLGIDESWVQSWLTSRCA